VTYRHKESERFWDRMAASYGEGAAVGRSLKGIEETASYVAETIKVDKGSRVLDLCCGNGLITNILAMRGASIAAVDLSGEMLKKGKAAAERSGMTNIRYIQGDASRLPFTDDTFDASYCLSSFQLFPSYDEAAQALRELLRVTRPSGKVLIGEIPWKGTFGYRIWDIIRTRGEGKAEGYVPFQDMPLHKRACERIGLTLRRFTGRRVASDEWLWYEGNFFKEHKGSKFSSIQIRPSQRKGLIRYQFDVVISNL
jgi:ubiquinone/menaquinone biosynthesis C-methylase UbiE